MCGERTDRSEKPNVALGTVRRTQSRPDDGLPPAPPAEVARRDGDTVPGDTLPGVDGLALGALSGTPAAARCIATRWLSTYSGSASTRGSGHPRAPDEARGRQTHLEPAHRLPRGGVRSQKREKAAHESDAATLTLALAELPPTCDPGIGPRVARSSVNTLHV